VTNKCGQRAKHSRYLTIIYMNSVYAFSYFDSAPFSTQNELPEFHVKGTLSNETKCQSVQATN